MKYRFDEIAINSTAKKKPGDADRAHYIGLEHIDSECLTITRWGSDVTPAGEKLVMKKGDVLFGKRRAYQRKVGIAPFDGIFSAHGLVLRPNTKIVDSEFFPFFISSDQFMERAVRISVGGLSPTINWKDLKEQEFNLPPIAEQKVLAEKLWAAYRLKESYKKLLTATQEMVKSQFIEMFKEDTNYTELGNIVIVKDDCRKPLNDGVRSTMKDGEIYPYYGATGIVDYINDYLTDEMLLCIAEDCGNYGAGMESSYIVNGKAWVNNHAHIVKMKDCCNIHYLHQYLKITNLMPYVSGTTRLKLTQKKLKEISVLLPSIDKQIAFVSITQQADKSGFVGVKSRFIEMFDQAPEVKLGDYITTQSGGTPNTKKTEYYEGGDIPWLSSGEVNQGYITSTEKFITQIGLDNSSAKWTPKDCVVIAMYGATAGKVGFVKIPLTTNQAVCTLLPCDNFKPIFLYYAVSQKTDWMIFKCQGAAQPNISQGIIRSMELPLPSMDEQDKFVSIAEQADKSGYYN